MAPVLVHYWHWTLYVWDFEREKVVVIDPKYRDNEKSDLEGKHKNSLILINKAMKECTESFFHHNYTEVESWQTEYLGVSGAAADR